MKLRIENCCLILLLASGPTLGETISSSYDLRVVFDGEVKVEDIDALAGNGGGSISAEGNVLFEASAEWHTKNGSLGVFAQSEARAGWLHSPAAKSSVTTSWNDRFTLVGDVSLLPEKVKINYLITADMTATTLDKTANFRANGRTVSAFGTLSGSVNGVSYSVGVGVPQDENFDSKSVSYLFSVDAILGPGGSSDFFKSFTANTDVSYGIVTINAGNTMGLQSITFPDGSLPEDHGFELVFDSGMPSPNIVPEPTGLILSAIAGLLSNRFRWRRKV